MASVAYFPQTPSHSISNAQPFSPHTSSPLASSSVFNSNHSRPLSMDPPSSPVMQQQSRRQLQFKSRQSGPAYPTSSPAFSTPSGSRPRARSSRYMKPAPGSKPAPIPFALTPTKPTTSTATSNQTDWIREKFKASCLERVKKARERKVGKGRGAASDPSSDGFDMSMDEDDDLDGTKDALDDEVLRRIFNNEERKAAHALALSFELDAGSSFDPAFEELLENGGEFEEQPPEEFMHDDSEPNPDDYGFAPEEEDEYGDDSWMDEYIARLPEEALEALSARMCSASGTPTPTATQVQQTHQNGLPSSTPFPGEAYMDDVMMG